MFSASYSITWAQATRHRAKLLAMSILRMSPTRPSTWLRTREYLWGWRILCTNRRSFPPCSTWRALPSTDTPAAPTRCHSPSLCCATCWTTHSTYEGLPPSGSGCRDRDAVQGHTPWTHTVYLGQFITPGNRHEPSRRVLVCYSTIKLSDISLLINYLCLPSFYSLRSTLALTYFYFRHCKLVLFLQICKLLCFSIIFTLNCSS